MKNDLISRQDAINALEEQLDYLRTLDKNENPTAEGKWYGVNWARNTIADLPPAERPQGEWLKYGDHAWKCSKCNCSVYVRTRNFCPDCGAKMKGGAE